LRDITRQSDFASRYGGEEFVMILPETDQESAIQVATKIHDAIRSSSFGTTTRPFTLTVSIGVSSSSTKIYSTWREMLDDADRALYLAKNTGKDKIEFWEAEKKATLSQTPAHP
jgi:diguanylate cyclase (GGDEF)-like protein